MNTYQQWLESRNIEELARRKHIWSSINRGTEHERSSWEDHEKQEAAKKTELLGQKYLSGQIGYNQVTAELENINKLPEQKSIGQFETVSKLITNLDKQSLMKLHGMINQLLLQHNN